METAPVARLVAERVRHLRRQRHWSAQQLADACAEAGMKTLSRGTIAKIESGVRKSVSAAEVQTLAKVLGVTPTELLAPERERPDRPLSLSESLRPLVDILEQEPFLHDHAGVSLYLALLADQLGEPLELPEYAEPRQLLYALVFACAQIPGGLRALADVLRVLNPESRHAVAARDLAAELEVMDFVAPGQREQLLTMLAGSDRQRLAATYRAAAAPYALELRPGVDDARHIVSRLEQMNTAPDGVPPLLTFVELVAAESEPAVAAGLREWSGSVARRLGLAERLREIRQRAAEQASSVPGMAEAYLIIKVEADALDDDHFHVRTWKQLGAPWQPEPGEDFTGDLAAVQRHVTDVLADAEAGWAEDAEIIRLEFLLPRELLTLPVDQWPAGVEENPPRPLGLQYQVVVRSLDRMQAKKWHRRWRQRWATLSGSRLEVPRTAVLPSGEPDRMPGAAELVIRTGSPGPAELRRLDATLAAHHQPLLVLERPLSRMSGDRPDEVSVGLRAGVPLMLWQRDERFAEEFESVLGELLAPDRDLRESARMLRIEAFRAEDPESHVGSHITLLWDDPHRLVELAGSLSAPR